MGLKVSGQVNARGLPFDLGQIGSFPGGVRGTLEAGNVRASEGGWIDLQGLKIDPKVVPKVKHVIKTIDRRDIGISVGSGVPRNRPEFIPVPSVSPVRQPIRVSQVQKPPQIIGGSKPQNPTFIPPIKAGLPKLNPRILNPPVIAPAKTKGILDVLIDIIKPNPITKVQPVALDLGNLLNVGLQAYQSYNYAKAQPVYDMQGFNPFSNVPLNQYDMAAPQLAVPGAGTGTCLPPGMKYDKCGNIVKTRRRRRKRLATSSDIKDLAALSSVTTGPEKKTWIATHPS